MLEQIENCLIAHKDFITLAFTLALILTSLVSAIIAYLSMREFRKQSWLQELVCLRFILHSSKLTLFEFKSKCITATTEQEGVEIDRAVVEMQNIIEQTQERIAQLEGKVR